MRFVVIGPGALGCLFAASLSADHKHEVWIVDHNQQRAAILARDGISLHNETIVKKCPVRATSNANEIDAVHCILLCVKSHQVQAALATNRAFLHTAPLTIAFQNGIGHLQTLATELPLGKWGVGVTAQGANLIGPGRVRHGGKGHTTLGFLTPPQPDILNNLQHIATALTEANIETTTDEQINQKIWQKLLINVGINALTASLDCTNGDLLHSPSSCQRMRLAILEGAAVAAALGIPINHEPVSLTMKVCRETATNISSMLQDVRNKRRTEIDAINGAIVHEGHRLGIPTPENKALVQKIKGLENSYLVDSA